MSYAIQKYFYINDLAFGMECNLYSSSVLDENLFWIHLSR